MFRNKIEAQQGRVIDMAGDSVLAIFGTATGAVNPALSIQAQVHAPAEVEPEDHRMRPALLPGSQPRRPGRHRRGARGHR